MTKLIYAFLNLAKAPHKKDLVNSRTPDLDADESDVCPFVCLLVITIRFSQSLDEYSNIFFNSLQPTQLFSW